MSSQPEKVKVPKLEVDAELLNELQELFKKADDQKERYDFTWNGKAKAFFEAATPSTKTLRPQPEESVNFENTENLFITGDNLEALKLLQESYLGKIDFIYIDPPYNTGKDFVYHDNFSKSVKEADEAEGNVDEDGNRLVKNERSAGRFHSDWLSMMYPRLKLARNLLADDAVIFISIDENEVANLTLMMDEIFGESNFVTNFVWEKKKKPSFLNANIGNKFEYILCYAKDRSNSKAFSVETTTKGKKYPFNNAGNSPQELIFPPHSVKFTSMGDQLVSAQDMSAGNIKTELLNDFSIVNGTNEQEIHLYGEWRYSQQKLNELVNEGSEITISSIPFRPNLTKSGGEIKKMHNLLTKEQYDVGMNEDATDEFTKLMGGNYFDYAKPTKLIKTLIKSYTYDNDNAVVLDFFVGSGTTAESVMQLNNEDGGSRKYIVATLDEAISDDNPAKQDGYDSIDQIARERIRRASDLLEDKSGFRVLKIDNLGIRDDVFKPADTTTQANIMDLIGNYRDDRTDYDLLYDVLVDGALEYNRQISKETIENQEIIKYDYFGELSGVICYFGKELTDELTREIAKMRPLIAVFKESTFSKSSQKVNVLEQFRINSPDTKVKVI